MTHYRTIEIDGIRMFYREAGEEGQPVLLLLHGFPASSFMFRELIGKLSDEFHLIAPDYPGFGYSDAPSPKKFPYTFVGIPTKLNASSGGKPNGIPG
jgi:pimeloyl-ACP methyl ester carboxylesterase